MQSVASCREVVECAVVGLNDMVKGEVPLALVVLRRGVGMGLFIVIIVDLICN